MILSSQTIRKLVEDGWISIQPRFDEQQLRPVGLRVHLGETILIPLRNQKIDLELLEPQEPRFERLDIRSSPLIVRPGDFVLGSTIESVKVHPGLACRIDGRSTLARMGLMIHCTSETIDSIHRDHRSIVLEISNIGPFELRIPYSYGIGMLVFEKLSAPVDINLEQDQYNGQKEATAPNLAFITPQYES